MYTGMGPKCECMGNAHCEAVYNGGECTPGVIFLGSGYFAVDGNLPLESILP